MKATTKQRSAQRAKTKSTTAAPAPRPTFTVDPVAITGTCDTGDLLENVLDELRTLLAVAWEMSAGTDAPFANLLSMAHRKAEAAAELYDNLDAVRAPTKEVA